MKGAYIYVWSTVSNNYIVRTLKILYSGCIVDLYYIVVAVAGV